MDKYNSKVEIINDNNNSLFLDKDGIIVLKSKNGANKQIEDILSEDEVFHRLGLYGNYVRGESHRCGAPCRSKEIEGKPCEIQTFREHCHFHR